jgi:hypothetical protein
MSETAPQTRLIGLSLGADLCWPAAFEELVRRLDLEVEVDGVPVRFATERITIEPFGLQQPCRYDVVLDRLTHWHHTAREWIKKATLLNDAYVLNNPWSLQSMEKHTSYCAMMRLGLPIPTTWMLPPKTQPDYEDADVTAQRYSRLFDLSEVADQVGYPAFLKPYDGGGWVGVRRVTDIESLQKAYDESGARVNHLQAAVKDWDVFVRAVGVGPQVNVIRYDPDKPLHGRYVVDFHYLDAQQWHRAQQITRTINAFFGWDFNSAEMLRSDDVLHPIDFANACPDSQVTSLHFHFPWLVKALLRWGLFCAATNRPFRHTLDWQPFFDVADTDLPFEEKLDRYDALAKAHFQTDEFEAFCAEHLGGLDRIALDYFSGADFKDIVRAKVSSLYPEHEIDSFTEHFYGLVQFWCHTERDRLGVATETDS